MMEFLLPTAEFLILLPGILLAYLPMKHCLRIPPARLAVFAGLISVLLAITGGSLCYMFSLKTLWLFFPVAAAAGSFYIHTLQISHWKSVSVFLAICGIFSCLGCVARTIDLILCHGNPGLWLSPKGVAAFQLLCWICVAISWYPSTHAAKKLLEEEAFAQTWYVFWILPLLFMGLNLFQTPKRPELLFLGRSMQLYIVNTLALLCLLLLFYALFYHMADSLNRNHRLRLENQFLSMQQAQYDNLRTAIEETREARHDMRHHISALQNLAARQEWEKLSDYLTEVWKSIPNADLNLCDNAALDGVASHYGLLCRKYHIPVSFEMDLPRDLPVPEIDLCLILSNLLENALEASLKTPADRRYIKAQAYLHSRCVVLLTVENTFLGTVHEKNGVFQSSKRSGEGIGIQSVRRIAEKNGGCCRFIYENDRFCANVMLQSETAVRQS